MRTFNLEFGKTITPRLDGKWAIKGLLPAKGLVVIYGPPGCGKSFLALNIGLSISSGKSFAGKKSTQAGVIYVAAEAGEGFKNRIYAGTQFGEFEKADEFALITTAPNLGSQTGDARQLIDEIARQCSLADIIPGVVVIDTLARVTIGGDENSARDMGGFVANVDLIAHELNTLVIIVHHSGKNTDLGMRGSSALNGAADTVIAVRNEDDHKRFLVEKQKDGEDNYSSTFRLKTVVIGSDRDGDTVTSCIVSNLSPLTKMVSRKGNEKKALKSAKLWMDTFQKTYQEKSEIMSMSDYSLGIAVIKIEDLKRAYYKRRPGDSVDTIRKAFDRGLTHAIENRFVESHRYNDEMVLSLVC